MKVFLQTHLHAEGTNTPEGVHAQLTGTMSTGVTLTLSAGLAVLAVEVGVFMSGTMINISMISDASVDIVNKTRDMSVTLEVNQELRSLAFSWGFFVRFWFIRWSKRKILVTYPVFGGLVKRTPIFK